MRLTLEQIRSVTFGVREVEERENGIYFLRFSPTQQAAWDASSLNHGQIAKKTSGARLDFHTDAETVLFDMAEEGRYEVMINGLPHDLIQAKAGSRYILSMEPGDKRVTFLLPAHSVGALLLVHIDEGAYLRPHVYDRKFLFLGDSITQGVTTSRDSANFVYRLSAFYNADVFSWGVGGTGFWPVSLEETAFDPEAVFIFYGTNDYNSRKSEDELLTRCRDYMDKVKDLWPDKKVFCISPIWRADGEHRRAAGTLESCRQLIISQAEEHGFIHIDGYKLCPHHTDYFADKFLHPNDLGFSVFAQNLLRELRDKL